MTSTVNNTLPTQVTNQLPGVVDQKLTPDLIAKGLKAQIETAQKTLFKPGKGAFYIRGFETVEIKGVNYLRVLPYNPQVNFCADDVAVPAQDVNGLVDYKNTNATMIISYLLSRYAVGKPVVMATRSYTDSDGFHCYITGIDQQDDRAYDLIAK
ncbi:MAG: hypothetical protein ACO2ZM_09140 [Francisellaceae bacterium]